eukprot:TRINITY_DN45610_c0_g1_i1.p1 TRINITY_DN45610_c0_g1~~TRINITY_DN45610_c0_g1_i1.p1  ORF type:complete len:251 (+),score=67.05 TRINITY_DN45610_c0_g1_i1:51-755(+)
MDDVPSLEDYVKGLRKRDAEADAEREAKRKRLEEKQNAARAEKEAAEKAAAEAAAAAKAAQAASVAATPMAGAFQQMTNFVKLPEPKDAVTEPSFDIVKEGGEFIERWELDASEKQVWVVGREASKVDFAVSHESCSRQHASVQLWQGQILIKDLGSAHGTHVDGRRLVQNVPLRLTSGANVRFGASTRVHIFRMPKFHSKKMIQAAKGNQQAQVASFRHRTSQAAGASSDFAQ